jgi:hypothetical protein
MQLLLSPKTVPKYFHSSHLQKSREKDDFKNKKMHIQEWFMKAVVSSIERGRSEGVLEERAY